MNNLSNSGQGVAKAKTDPSLTQCLLQGGLADFRTVKSLPGKQAPSPSHPDQHATPAFPLSQSMRLLEKFHCLIVC